MGVVAVVVAAQPRHCLHPSHLVSAQSLVCLLMPWQRSADPGAWHVLCHAMRTVWVRWVVVLCGLVGPALSQSVQERLWW